MISVVKDQMVACEVRARYFRAKAILADREGYLLAEGRTPTEIERLLAPLNAIVDLLDQRLAEYSAWIEGALVRASLAQLPSLLVGLRIRSGLDPLELTDKLRDISFEPGCDEDDGYGNLTLARALQVIEALGARIDLVVPGGVLNTCQPETT